MAAALMAGVVTGAIAGLLPGVHTNNTSAVMLGLSPVMIASGIEPFYIASMIVASTIAQSFFDIIPSIFVGVPDESTVLAVMPGHRMLLDGRGIEAVRLSASGSSIAILISLALILPLSVFFQAAYPAMQSCMALILTAISSFIILSGSLTPDDRLRKVFWSLFIFLAAGMLGILSFSVEPSLTPFLSIAAPSVLLPLLSGLFGAPTLLMSMRSSLQVPRQSKSRMQMPVIDRIAAAGAGTIAGALVSWFPAVSSGVATSITSLFSKKGDDSDERYLIAVSGVNTAGAVFSLVALFIIMRPRSGALAAAQEIVGGSISLETFILFLGIICAAGALCYPLTILAGSYGADIFSRIDHLWMNRFVLIFLAAMCLTMTGLTGLAIFLTSTSVGIAAHVSNVKKTCLMGVLLIPCILYFL